jgi:protease-4
MKTKILFLLLTIPSFSYGIFDSIFAPEIEEKALTPTVAILYINDKVSTKKTMASLVSIAKNPDIHAILFMVNCSGGKSTEFVLLQDLIKTMTKFKPTIGFITGVAFSGGYMVASALDYIFAQSGAQIGSIGALLERQIFKDAKLMGAIESNFEVIVFQAGTFKGLMTPYKNISNTEKEALQSYVDRVYEQFVDIVSINRKLTRAEYPQWAEGKIFLADQARALGLIDELGTIFDVEEKIVSLIKERNPGKSFENDLNFAVFETKKKSKPQRTDSSNLQAGSGNELPFCTK